MISVVYKKRQENVFILLSGIFLGSLGILNILGVSRFVDLSFSLFGISVPMVVAVGALPYPITFLCTDLISELYGRKKASFLVWIGLFVNIWIVFILWFAGVLPGFEAYSKQGLLLKDAAGRIPVFYEVQNLAFGAVAASMIAYIVAQFIDVYLFHFWKKLTKGRHLWLRNNASTLVSQLIDTSLVILITHFYTHALPISSKDSLFSQLLLFILSGYIFKVFAALLDTIPFYFLVYWLRPYLGLKDEFKDL